MKGKQQQKLVGQKLQSHKLMKNKRQDLDQSSTSIHRMANPAGTHNPNGGLMGSRRFGGKNNSNRRNYEDSSDYVSHTQEDDNYSTSDMQIIKLGGQSEFDDQSSYLSLRQGEDGFSDV